MKTLIVDDEVFSREFVIALLRSIATCDQAGSAKEAIRKFKAALESDDPYDLIVMDIMMPGLGGHEAVETIRSIENAQKPGNPVSIVMLTGLNTAGDAMEAFCSAQSAAYLVKPVSKDDLHTTLSKLGLLWR